MSIAPPLLSVEGLSKSYGGVHAVRRVTFQLRQGEILALIGPNGAGKSTCFDMLNGQTTASAGRIKLLGQDTSGRKPREMWRLGVGRTFQITATFPTMTGRENIQVALVSYRKQLFNLLASTPRFAQGGAGHWLVKARPKKFGATPRSAPSILARAWFPTPAIARGRPHETLGRRAQQLLRARAYPVRCCA